MIGNRYVKNKFFWVKDFDALVCKSMISPDEYFRVIKIEHQYNDGTSEFKQIKRFDNYKRPFSTSFRR